jgi:hypothetical protein
MVGTLPAQSSGRYRFLLLNTRNKIMPFNAFMPPALPQTPAPDLNRAPGKSSAAFKSNRLGESSDQSKSFSATLNRISDRNPHHKPNSTAAEKQAVRSRGSDNGSVKPDKISKTKSHTLDDIEESGAPVSPVSGKESRPIHPWLAFGLVPYHLINGCVADEGSVAAEALSDSTTGPDLRMLNDLIAHLHSQAQKTHGEWVGIGPFEQLQANMSPEALNRFFFKQLAAGSIHHQDSGDLKGKPALDGILNGQPGSSGASVNAPLNPLLHLLGMTGAAGGVNPNISSSAGLNMAAGLETPYLNEDFLLKMATSSQSAETGISENAKMVAAGPDGRLSFWTSGDSNSETLLKAQARQMGENSQPLKNQAALKAAVEQPANPNSATEGVTAKTPEEVFGIKSAVLKSEIAPLDGLDHKITQINGDSKDSGFLFSQDQLPPHLARLENAAQSSETAQRSLMPQTLNQIVQKAVLSLHNGQHEVQIDLKPDFLGHIRMQIVSEGQQVAIKIVAEFPFVKDMLENNLHQLKAELQSQGLDIDELEVSVAHDSHREGDTHQTDKTAKVRAAGNGTDIDDGSSEKPGQSQSLGGAVTETAIDYFA